MLTNKGNTHRRLTTINVPKLFHEPKPRKTSNLLNFSEFKHDNSARVLNKIKETTPKSIYKAKKFSDLYKKTLNIPQETGLSEFFLSRLHRYESLIRNAESVSKAMRPWNNGDRIREKYLKTVIEFTTPKGQNPRKVLRKSLLRPKEILPNPERIYGKVGNLIKTSGQESVKSLIENNPRPLETCRTEPAQNLIIANKPKKIFIKTKLMLKSNNRKEKLSDIVPQINEEIPNTRSNNQSRNRNIRILPYLTEALDKIKPASDQKEKIENEYFKMVEKSDKNSAFSANKSIRLSWGMNEIISQLKVLDKTNNNNY